MVWGGRRVQDGEHVYTCGRWHVDIWQNQYNIIKLKNKIKNKIREIQFSSLEHVICTDFIDLYNSLMEISLRFPKDVS